MAPRQRGVVRIEPENYRWSALRVIASPPSAPAEFALADALDADGYLAYCPIAVKRIFWDGRRQAKKSFLRQYPAYARYIFVGCPQGFSPPYRRDYRLLEATLGDASGPIDVPAAAIRLVNELELAGEWDEGRSWQDKCGWKIGSQVSIRDGPLSGFRAMVDAIESERRIRLLVDWFGRPTATYVAARQITA